MSNVAFQISDHTITFFAKGRPWTVASDAKNFAKIREGLLTSTLSVDELVELADVKEAIKTAIGSDNLLRFVGDTLQYKDHTLANVWVDKIMLFKAQGLPFDPVFKALESLMANPSFSARERLPVFVERSRLGFLPDGRIAAFKVIRDDWRDVNSGTFDNSIGKIVEMSREDVDDDPDHSCSHGLHVGALEYIPNFGLYQDDRRVVLVAVHAEDFVAIPKDYNGSKARVCKYEVLEEVDKKFIKDFVENNQGVVRSASASESEPKPEPALSTYERVVQALRRLDDEVDFDEDTQLAILSNKEISMDILEAEIEDEFRNDFQLDLKWHMTIADVVRLVDEELAELDD